MFLDACKMLALLIMLRLLPSDLPPVKDRFRRPVPVRSEDITGSVLRSDRPLVMGSGKS